MTKRVSPIDRVRAEIDQLFAATERPLTEILEDVGRLSVRLLFQTAVEPRWSRFCAGRAISGATRTARPGIAMATDRRRR